MDSDKNITVSDATEILGIISPIYKNKRFCIVETSAHTGIASTVFAKSPLVGLVVAFADEDEERTQLVSRNVVVEEEGFDFQDLSDYTGGTLIINSMSLEFENPRINEETNKPLEPYEIVEEFLTEYYKVFYQIFIYDVVSSSEEIKDYVPDKSFLESVGMELSYHETGLLFVQKSKLKYINQFRENEYGLHNAPSLPNLAKPEAEAPDEEDVEEEEDAINSGEIIMPDVVEEYQEQSAVFPKAIPKNWKQFCAEIVGKKESESWNLKSFQNYIRNILVNIVKEDMVDRMITRDMMKIWVQAVTHESFDMSANYETIETTGDKTLDYVTLKYLYRRFPNITPKGLTAYKIYYMSKPQQSKFADEMKLTSWLLIDQADLTQSIREDMFEAFSGALEKVGDSIADGLGVTFVMNFIILLFSSQSFSKEIAKGDYRSQLEQAGSMLKIDPGKDAIHGGIVIRDRKNPDNTVTVTIALKPTLIQFLRDTFNVKMIENFVSITDFTKKKAETRAWYEAYQKMKKIGYTYAFAEEMRYQRNFINHMANNEALVNRVKSKAAAAGIKNLLFKKPKNTETNVMKTIALVGNNTNGKLVKLSIARAPDERTAEISAMEKYVMV